MASHGRAMDTVRRIDRTARFSGSRCWVNEEKSETCTKFSSLERANPGRQPLTGVLFPDVEGPLFLFGRKAVVFDQIIGSFIVGLRMFNFVDLRFRSMGHVYLLHRGSVA